MIRARAGKVSGGGAALRCAALLLLAALRPAPAPAAAAPWWDLELRLSVEGSYRVASGGVAVDGGYFWTVVWLGMMERDGFDLRLFHTGRDLVRWEAKEKACRPEGVVRLATADFPDAPEFDLNFVLRQGDRFVFDLAGRGFAVPIAPSPAKAKLLLPASAENGRSVDGVDYNAGVFKGSNRVAIPAEALLKGPVKTTFAWEWKCGDGTPGPGRAVEAAQRHKVELTVSVRPHREAEPRAPGPPAGGGPSPHALGWKRS